MRLDELIATIRDMPPGQRAGLLTDAIKAMDALDLALLISVLGGLAFADDLEPDYISNRVREWADTKSRKG